MSQVRSDCKPIYKRISVLGMQTDDCDLHYSDIGSGQTAIDGRQNFCLLVFVASPVSAAFFSRAAAEYKLFPAYHRFGPAYTRHVIVTRKKRSHLFGESGSEHRIRTAVVPLARRLSLSRARAFSNFVCAFSSMRCILFFDWICRRDAMQFLFGVCER